MFKIELDDQLACNLRNAITEQEEISQKIVFKNEYAWNRLCTIMDRIDDLVVYLNQLELNTGKWTRSAFDFYDFINESSVLIDCIDLIIKIYNINMNIKKTNIFTKKSINQIQKNKLIINNKLDEKENDNMYFKYIRSLCSVHPAETNGHLIYQSDSLEVSPYVIWNNNLTYNDGDLIVEVYNETDSFKNILIKVDEIFNYVKYKYGLLNYIIKEIKKYNCHIIKNLKKQKIEGVRSFSTYDDYLDNLIKESNVRCKEISYYLNQAKNYLNIGLSNKLNFKQYKLYCNALKYAIKIEHNNLQRMSFEFLNESDHLLPELVSPLNKYLSQNFHYQLEKICYLKGENGDLNFGKVMLKPLLPLLSKYIYISEDEYNYLLDYYELFVLSRIGLYLYCLNNESLINNVIPMNKKYRL